MPSSTFCLHGYTRLYFSFTQSEIGAFEQIDIHNASSPYMQKPQCKSFKSKIILWKPMLFADPTSFGWNRCFLFQITFVMREHEKDSCRTGWRAQSDGEVIQKLPCFQSRSLLTSNLSLFMPSLWFIHCHCCALAEKKCSFSFFSVYSVDVFTDNNHTLLIFPFARRSEVTPFQSSRS